MNRLLANDFAAAHHISAVGIIVTVVLALAAFALVVGLGIWRMRRDRRR